MKTPDEPDILRAIDALNEVAEQLETEDRNRHRTEESENSIDAAAIERVRQWLITLAVCPNVADEPRGQRPEAPSA